MLSSWATLSDNMVPVFIAAVLLIAKLKGVRIYEVFVAGAAEGFSLGVKMIPYLAAILAAVGVARSSGLLEFFLYPLQYPLSCCGFPSELLPMALIRPLSGSASFALMIDVLQTHGPDSTLGLIASSLQGATDTTFYILTVYFGSVGITRFRYALFVGLLADMVGMVVAVMLTRLFYSF
ncbi:MAG TPA: nucleoside recognition domain-containing protein [bacterium]|nr:nucleoside recognition domain-containing protein [bacterium]